MPIKVTPLGSLALAGLPAGQPALGSAPHPFSFFIFSPKPAAQTGWGWLRPHGAAHRFPVGPPS